MSYLVIALVVLFDQLTKFLAQSYLAPVDTVPLIDGALHFTYSTNSGAAWGILKDAPWVFMLVSCLAIVAIICYLILSKTKFYGAAISLALICGGGIGNMIDRIFRGEVIDFIDFRLISFPVFNLADSCVCVGTFLFVIFYLVDEWKKQKTKAGL